MFRIHIRQGGYLGNHMYQYMLARTLEHDSGRKADISGHNMEPWSLAAPAQNIPSEKTFEIRSNLFDYKKLVADIRAGKINDVVIRSLAMRMEYYKDPAFYRPFFQARAIDVPPVGEDKLLIHVRGGDILGGIHPDHHPLPFRYYRHLIETTGLKPVFMGQIGEDEHSRKLKEEFKDCEFLPQSDILTDFETMRRARTVAISVSSFAWMATWLSESVTRIYCPVAGFLLPAQRPDIDVLPRDDARYVFYQFPVWKFKGDGADYDRIFGSGMNFRRVVTPRKISYPEAWARTFARNKKNGLIRRLEKLAERVQ